MTKVKTNNVLIIVPLFFVLLILILIGTNPNQAQFKEFIREELVEEANSDSPISGAIMTLLSKPVAWFINLNTTRYNMVVFSIYDVYVVGNERVYIGVLNNFIRVE